jgi:hypothetical protein
MLTRPFSSQKSNSKELIIRAGDKPLPEAPIFSDQLILNLAISSAAAIIVALRNSNSFSNGQQVSNIQPSQILQGSSLQTAITNAVSTSQTTPIAFTGRFTVR